MLIDLFHHLDQTAQQGANTTEILAVEQQKVCRHSLTQSFMPLINKAGRPRGPTQIVGAIESTINLLELVGTSTVGGI